VLTSLGVPGRPLGNPQVVGFNLGHGGVPRGRPVAGQLQKKFLFPNGDLQPLPAAVGDWAWVARTGSGQMLMCGDIFAASHGGGAGC